MRINNLPFRNVDLVAELRDLAAIPDKVAAARGRKLLELVEHLNGQGPTPQVFGTLFQNELHIMLVDSHAHNITTIVETGPELLTTSKATGAFDRDDMRRRLAAAVSSVTVWVDWYDHGEMQDGLPIMHYRLQKKRSGTHLSDDARADDLIEAEQLILRFLHCN